MTKKTAEQHLARVLNTILNNEGGNNNPYSRPGVKAALEYLNEQCGGSDWSANDWQKRLVPEEPRNRPPTDKEQRLFGAFMFFTLHHAERPTPGETIRKPNDNERVMHDRFIAHRWPLSMLLGSPSADECLIPQARAAYLALCHTWQVQPELADVRPGELQPNFG